MTVKVVHKTEEMPDEPIDGKPTLVYWNIVGLALPIRLALVYTGVNFVDVRIEAGDPSAPDFLKAWHNAKHGHLEKVMHFPNLPYYLDGEVSVSQTNTILRYVARKHHLPHTSGQEHMGDLACDQLTDLEAHMVILGYEKGPDDVLKWYTQEVPGIIAKFSKMLGETAYLTGDKPSIDDFKLYSFLHKMNIIQEDLGSPETAGTVTADLVAYMKRIEELPRIKEYMASPDYMSKPVNRSMAKWDGH